MAVIVLQPHGLGDHIFCHGLVHQLADRHEIVWPVLPHFLPGLKKAYPNINWLPVGIFGPQIENVKRDCVINGNRILPIRWADQLLRVPYKDCMRAKYDMFGLDWNSWVYFPFEKDYSKAEQLFHNVLKIDETRQFRLINKRFTSLETKAVKIQENLEMQNIEMVSIPGFSLFDWFLVIEKATEIHTVGTSINYLIEQLNVMAKEIVLYKRLPDENHYHNYDYILKRHKYVFT
ncbi:MAG: hypothetical protein BWZ05_02062 [Bacteroidetes bacterium ADurb.BinA245]|nr:MAG: hypothetical protein BWZ05_02062 [Bacteroidetes bacterium ADurb.BinA245]